MLFFQPWKTWTVVIVCLLGVIFASPNLVDRKIIDSLPSWLPKRQVSLGLDLQGGSHLLLEADIGSVVKERMNGDLDTLRTHLIKQKIGYTSLAVENGRIAVTLRDPADLDKVRTEATAVDPELEVTAQPNGAVAIQYSEHAIDALATQAVAQSVEVVRKRVDELGTREPTIAREGTSRILVQVPGYDDPERLKAMIGKTAKLTFQMVDDTADPTEVAAGHVPPGDDLLSYNSAGDKEKPSQTPILVRKRITVDGGDLVSAQAGFDGQNGQPVINFRFNSIGSHKFGEATQQNVGKRFAIVLDNKVLSAPVIREPILGGSGQISGSFTTASATDLAGMLNAGALPTPLTIIEERTVGPDLGADSIHAGALAAFIAVILVAVFMVLFYGLFGIYADIALFFNLALLMAALSLLGATLTLPGIAGMALTMGMAVDANVLVNERIREEVRLGRTMISAIDAGFSKAYATIVDANVTHLIAGIFLFWLGSGPVKGFAVTLCLGILTSLFTTIMVSRLLVVWWLRGRPKVLPI
jgi:protein-export membrane protein SecD